MIDFNQVVDAIHRFNDMKAVSLPQFTKPALIESPLFLQESLIEEPAVNDVIKNLYNIYIGYILLSLQMNDMVVGNRRVRDMLSTVSTSGFGLVESNECYVGVDQLIAGLEDLSDLSEPAHQTGGGGQAMRHNEKTSMPIASGRQVEVKFAVGEKKAPITVVLNVRFNPRIIPESVVEYVLSANFNLDISKRWLQMQAGEIRFISDFLFNLDKLERRTKALKHDKDGALQDIFRNQNLSTMRTAVRAATGFRTRSYNLANSVMILDDHTARLYGKKTGLDFDNLSNRRKFFASTYNLFVVLIDSRYSRATIYTNGIDHSASFSFNELKASGSSDSMGISEIMDYLAKSQMPRL
jgi:hypothetical protein